MSSHRLCLLARFSRKIRVVARGILVAALTLLSLKPLVLVDDQFTEDAGLSIQR